MKSREVQLHVADYIYAIAFGPNVSRQVEKSQLKIAFYNIREKKLSDLE